MTTRTRSQRCKTCGQTGKHAPNCAAAANVHAKAVLDALGAQAVVGAAAAASLNDTAAARPLDAAGHEDRRQTDFSI